MLNIFPQPLCSGDTIPLKLTFKKTDGTAYNLTGSTVGATVKLQPDDQPDTTDALWMASVAGDATGVIQFYIGPLDDGDYWFDVKMWQTTGGNQIRTAVLAPLQMHLIQSVTARAIP